MQVQNGDEDDCVNAFNKIRGIREPVHQGAPHASADIGKLAGVVLYSFYRTGQLAEEFGTEGLTLLHIPSVGRDNIRLGERPDDQVNHDSLFAG